LEVECYKGLHFIVSLFVAAPCLLVWCKYFPCEIILALGIPFFALIAMRRYKKRLDLTYVKAMLGFLYNGYKRHSYYWEVVIMYRKIMIIFIQVFLVSLGVIVQALVVLLFLVLCVGLNIVKQPFDN